MFRRGLGVAVVVLVCATTVGALSCSRVVAVEAFGVDHALSCTAKPDITAQDIESVYEYIGHGSQLLRDTDNTTLIVVPWLLHGNETFEDNARRIDPLCQEDLDTLLQAIDRNGYEPGDFFYLIPDDPAMLAQIPSGEDPRTCQYPQKTQIGDFVGVSDDLETKEYCYETKGSSGCPSTVIDGHAFITTMIAEDNYQQAIDQVLRMYWLVLVIGIVGVAIGLKRGFQYLDPRGLQYKRGAAVLGGYILVTGSISLLINLAESNPWAPMVILIDDWFLEAVMIAYMMAGLSRTPQTDDTADPEG